MLQHGAFFVYCMAGCIRFAIKSETVHCHKKNCRLKTPQSQPTSQKRSLWDKLKPYGSIAQKRQKLKNSLLLAFCAAIEFYFRP